MHRRNRESTSVYWTFAAGTALALLSAGPAQGKPGTYGPIFGTWDTRASSITGGAQWGFMGSGHFHTASYFANFTATSGNLSSQFGVHYLNYDEGGGTDNLHGLGGTATAVFSLPMGERFANGVPRFALGFMLGGAPSALTSGELNYLTLPLVLGIGLPISPAPMFTITPWAAVAASVDLDSRFNSVSITSAEAQKFITYTCAKDPTTGVCLKDSSGKDVPDPTTIQVKYTAQDAQNIVSKSVTLDIGANISARGGLRMALLMGDTANLELGYTATQTGSFSHAFLAHQLGLTLLVHWDSVVPAVLPAETRLISEPCDAVERRFRMCPEAKKWITPEKAPLCRAKPTLQPDAVGPRATPSAPLSPPVNPPPPDPKPEPKPEPVPVPPAGGAIPPPPDGPAPATPPPAPEKKEPEKKEPAPPKRGTSSFDPPPP